LISIGIRALVEECWKHDILLIGIVKDSASRYLTRNYVGVMDYIGRYEDVPHVALPWSDRDFLETLIWIDDSIVAPWSTIEFDSVFMTLHVEKDERGNKNIFGVRGNIVAPPERLFVHSLAQFYLDRSKKSPLYGHVIFIDRLLLPKLENLAHVRIDQNKEILGVIEPIAFLDRNTEKQCTRSNDVHTGHFNSKSLSGGHRISRSTSQSGLGSKKSLQKDKTND